MFEFNAIRQNMISACKPIIGDSDYCITHTFLAIFGVTLNVAVQAFLEIADDAQMATGFANFSEQHLLWGLYLLKCYPTDRVGAVFVGATVKTFIKWSKHAINHIATLYSQKVSRLVDLNC